MFIKKSTLGAAVVAAMAIGVAGQASAYTSAGSKIEYQNLTVTVLDANGNPAPASVDSFNLVTTNTATLNGDSGIDSDSCAGVPFVSNTCNAGPPRLDSDLIAKGTTAHAANTFTLDGPNAGTEYSYSDSAILTAQLAGDADSSGGLIAETELLTTGSGNSSSTIQSTTGFTFTFTVNGPGPFTLDLALEANPGAYSASDNPNSILTIAESSVSFLTELTQDSGGTGSASWNPDGDDTNGCTGLNGGVACSGEVDEESLNTKTGVTSDPAFDPYSAAETFSSFAVRFEGLTAGEWTFTLTTTVANSVTKTVPVPGTLLLMGLGLAGLAGAGRRRKLA